MAFQSGTPLQPLHTASPAAPSQKHEIKTLWRPQLLLWAAAAGWSLLKPDPATLRQPGSPLSLKGCLTVGGEGMVVEVWQARRGRRQQLRGALRNDLERTSPVTHLFMTNLLSELLLLHRKNRTPLRSKSKILVKTCEQRRKNLTKTYRRPLHYWTSTFHPLSKTLSSSLHSQISVHSN